MSVLEILGMGPADLIDYLTSKGWAQEKIALEVGVTQPTICRIRKGDHKQPRHTLVDSLRQLVLRIEEL